MKNLHHHLPTSVQNMIYTYYGYNVAKIRYSKEYERYLRFLNESQYWSKGEIENYQNEKLRELIKYVYTFVPYYKNLMSNLKLTPDDIKYIEDLPKLPVLGKDTVRKNKNKFISSESTKRTLIKATTGGTTGSKLELYKTADTIARQWAVWWRHRSRYGVNLGDRHVNFTFKDITSVDKKSPPFWNWNYYLNQLLIGMNQITPQKIPYIIEYIEKRKFKFFSGPPSLLYALSSMALEQNIELHNKPGYVFYGAENMHNFQRHSVENFTGAVITDQYGTAEGVGNISRCEKLKYHEDFEFGIIEYEEPLKETNGQNSYEMICTGLSNYAFPLIRYRIGDRAVLHNDSEQRCTCGRESRQVDSITGRVDDYIMTPEGHRIRPPSKIYSVVSGIKEAQVVQYKPGEIMIRLVVRDHYSKVDEEHIKKQFKDTISRVLKVNIEYVDEIEREKNGKFMAVKNHINKDIGNLIDII